MENPLAALQNFASNFNPFRKKEGSALGVDIGSSSIKIVQLRKQRGVAVLETYGEIALGPYADSEIGRATNLSSEKLSEALDDLSREANVTTKNAGISIPFSSSLTALIQMPALDKDRLATMIPLEARKYIPVPISEVALDWFIIPDSEARFIENTEEKAPADGNFGKTNVLLVAIHNDALEKYRRIVLASKLESAFFEIEIFSAIRAVLDQGVAPVMVLDIGAATTKLYIVEYGIVRMSHIINRGGQDITLAISRSLGITVRKAEEMKREFGLTDRPENRAALESTSLVLDHMLAEANRVAVGYQTRFNKNIAKAVLTGGGSALRGLKERATRALEREVILADPFAKTETPAFIEEVLKDVGPSFSVAVGLALRKLQELG